MPQSSECGSGEKTKVLIVYMWNHFVLHWLDTLRSRIKSLLRKQLFSFPLLLHREIEFTSIDFAISCEYFPKLGCLARIFIMASRRLRVGVIGGGDVAQVSGLSQCRCDQTITLMHCHIFRWSTCPFCSCYHICLLHRRFVMCL